jgi:hypothetical protein
LTRLLSFWNRKRLWRVLLKLELQNIRCRVNDAILDTDLEINAIGVVAADINL